MDAASKLVARDLYERRIPTPFGNDHHLHWHQTSNLFVFRWGFSPAEALERLGCRHESINWRLIRHASDGTFVTVAHRALACSMVKIDPFSPSGLEAIFRVQHHQNAARPADKAVSNSRGSVNKPILNISIVLTAMFLSVFHYELKPSPSDKEVREEAQGMSRGVEWRGQIAPDFELKTTKGAPFRLSDNVGKKIIVLNFFATWCGPCRAEMPELNRYFNEHKSESFLLLGIDAEEKEDRVEAFLDELKVDFPAGVDDGPLRRQYGVESFPTTVVIGVDGKVQFYETGALVNAEVAFDNLLQKNRQLMQAGRVISPEDYRLQAQKQSALPSRQPEQNRTAEQEYKLDERGKRIVARMDCPCGCDDKVVKCSCNNSKKIKKALASEDFKDQSDDEIMKSLNKRFCSGVM